MSNAPTPNQSPSWRQRGRNLMNRMQSDPFLKTPLSPLAMAGLGVAGVNALTQLNDQTGTPGQNLAAAMAAMSPAALAVALKRPTNIWGMGGVALASALAPGAAREAVSLVEGPPGMRDASRVARQQVADQAYAQRELGKVALENQLAQAQAALQMRAIGAPMAAVEQYIGGMNQRQSEAVAADAALRQVLLNNLGAIYA